MDINCVDFIENAYILVLVIFADHHCLFCFLSTSRSKKETTTASFQEVYRVGLAIVLITY